MQRRLPGFGGKFTASWNAPLSRSCMTTTTATFDRRDEVKDVDTHKFVRNALNAMEFFEKGEYITLKLSYDFRMHQI